MPTSTTSATISPAELRAALQHNPDDLVVDVRTPAEFASGHVPGSINLPLDQVNAHLERIVRDAGGHMTLVCQSGNRACQAHDALAGAGLRDVRVLNGGIAGWLAAGAPVDVTGEPDNWTIERQVRLVAGGAVVASTAASLVWPPARFLAGAVGAGLTFAALSNTCALGSVLARMPFNRAPSADVDEALTRLAAAA